MRAALAAAAVSPGMLAAEARAATAPADSGYETGAIGAADDVILPAPTPLTAPQTLYLDVTLNGSPRGLLPFTESAGQLRADPAVLRQLGFSARGDAPVPLEQISGVVVRYDASMQTLALEVPLEQLDLPTTEIGRACETAPMASASPGALLNYDVYASQNEDAGNLALTAEARVFGLGRGVLRSSQLLRTFQDGNGGGWRGESVRLDSRWEVDFPDQALTLTVGDFFSGFVDWSRPVRMGGIQIGRNYGLQPYRVLTPTPSFLGEAVVPSTVELYVDGLRQYNGEVPVGPFQLGAQPGISGTGNAQVVITDAYGRMQTLDFSFYGTQQLLAEGLSDWSAGVGRMRRDYGIRSFAYDDATVGSATWRRGVSNRFTAELHAEGGGGIASAGAGGWWQLGLAGVLNASYAHSRRDGRDGGQWSLGYSWNNRVFNLNAATLRTHGDFQDLGSLQGARPPDVTDQVTAGASLGRLGSLSASYLRLSYPDGDDRRYASVFWNRTFSDRWSAYASFNQNLDESADRSIYLSVSASLGRNRQSNLALQRNGDRNLYTVDVSQPVPGDGSQGGYGWRVQARHGDDGTGGLAEVGWLNRVGRYSAGAARQGDSTFAYANASGSLVWMGGHVFAAREVPDAFAVVSTNGVAGVPVRLENRPIGVTDRNGLLLVTPLLSWQRNRLSIDTLDLPADMRAERVDTQVTPRQSAGLGVSFGLRRIRAITLVLHDAQDQPLPAGSQVRLPDQRSATVGYDGEVYLEDLPTRARLDVDTPEGRCMVEVPLASATGSGPVRLGPLRCQPDTTP
ncbi:fimbria/pilus outer membrane usher protein [Stenotrophomonas sp.]|uniref:fimbria/pilus outer membrane usher protein n=1 Tax=Stenotrophomonas sp. TaxID=69392 RepID=UPI0028A0667F|nr:fimbria/pilus outer membrane usher protein [Stenotrophomonas sp.]